MIQIRQLFECASQFLSRKKTEPLDGDIIKNRIYTCWLLNINPDVGYCYLLFLPLSK